MRISADMLHMSLQLLREHAFCELRELQISRDLYGDSEFAAANRRAHAWLCDVDKALDDFSKDVKLGMMVDINPSPGVYAAYQRRGEPQ